jgi:hypothetical protein
MGPLEALAAWYSRNCNGTWEHQYGVEISTLDNPGWQVKIDLRGTRLDVVDGPRVEVTRSESDWVTCRVVDGQYQGFGGPTNLLEILEHFREFLGMQAPE